MARACGSYPQCQRFKSVRRYHRIPTEFIGRILQILLRSSEMIDIKNKALWSSG